MHVRIGTRVAEGGRGRIVCKESRCSGDWRGGGRFEGKRRNLFHYAYDNEKKEAEEEGGGGLKRFIQQRQKRLSISYLVRPDKLRTQQSTTRERSGGWAQCHDFKTFCISFLLLLLFNVHSSCSSCSTHSSVIASS